MNPPPPGDVDARLHDPLQAERSDVAPPVQQPADRRPPRPETPGTPGEMAGAPPAPARSAVPKTPIRTGRLPRRAPGMVAGAALLAAVGLATVTGIGIGLLVVAAVLVAGVVVYAWSRRVENRRRAADRAVTFAVIAAFGLAMVPLVSLLWTVTSKGLTRFDADFFSMSMRNVVGEGGGVMHALIGTGVITALATAAAVPIGILTAIYMVEYGGDGRLKRALTFFVDVMTGIPSIVAGLFAFALFALFFGPGVRMGVMGSVALTVLMIPIVVRSTEEMLKVVPHRLREAAYALGVPKWRTVVKVVLPTAAGGIVTGVMLAVARIIGETAPLLITTGTFSSINWNPFDGRMQALPVLSYNQYKSPGVPPEPSFDRAWAAALLLILIVMLLNLIARLVSRRKGVTA